MNGWLSSLPPRIQGLMTLIISASVVLVGVLVGRVLEDQFYPIVIPLGCAVAPSGLFQIITGHSRDDIAHRRVPLPLMIGLFASMLLGGLIGLELNKLFFGVRW